MWHINVFYFKGNFIKAIIMNIAYLNVFRIYINYRNKRNTRLHNILIYKAIKLCYCRVVI